MPVTITVTAQTAQAAATLQQFRQVEAYTYLKVLLLKQYQLIRKLTLKALAIRQQLPVLLLLHRQRNIAQ